MTYEAFGEIPVRTGTFRAVVRAGATVTSYERTGHGDPVLLLVGPEEDIATPFWQAIKRAIGAQFRLVVPDPSPATGDLSGWLGNFLDGLGVEAASFVAAYYAQFPKLKEFLAAQVDTAKVDGFTTTMFGRRRYLPELLSANFRLRALGERMALNAPIQGRAADIMKKAMIGVDEALRKEPVAKMLLTVHDELVFEVSEEKLDQARTLIEKEMIGAADLRCGLAVDVHSGTNWAEAHA